MNTKAFASIIHLRYQLFKRLLFTKSRLKIWLPQFIGVILFLFMLSFLFIKGNAIQTIFFLLASGDRNVVTGILFAILLSLGTTAIAYILIVGTNLSGQISFGKMSYLPISPLSFYFSELLASFVDIWTPIIFIVQIALIVGIGSAFSIGKIIANGAFIISLIVMLGASSQFLIYFLNFLFNLNQSNRLRNFFSFLFFLLFFSIVGLTMVLINQKLGQGAHRFSAFFYHSHLEFSPIGVVAEGLSRLSFNDDWRSILAPFVLSIGYICIFFAAGYLFFIKSLTKKLSGKERKAAGSKRLMMTDRLLAPIFPKNSILIAKEFQYLLRSPRTILFCIAGVLLMWVNVSTISLRRPEFNLMVLIWLIYPALILLLDSPYIFSYDEQATTTYFFAPISLRDFIFIKNITVFIFVFIFQILLTIFALVFLNLPEAASFLLSAIFINGYLSFSYLSIVNKIVIENPPALKFNSLFGRSNTNIGFSFGWLIVILAVVMIFYFLFNKSIVLLVTGYACLFLLATIFYFVSLPKFPKRLAENQEYFIRKISGQI